MVFLLYGVPAEMIPQGIRIRKALKKQRNKRKDDPRATGARGSLERRTASAELVLSHIGPGAGARDLWPVVQRHLVETMGQPKLGALLGVAHGEDAGEDRLRPCPPGPVAASFGREPHVVTEVRSQDRLELLGFGRGVSEKVLEVRLDGSLQLAEVLFETLRDCRQHGFVQTSGHGLLRLAASTKDLTPHYM